MSLSLRQEKRMGVNEHQGKKGAILPLTFLALPAPVGPANSQETKKQGQRRKRTGIEKL